MKRRDFLKAGALGAIMLGSNPRKAESVGKALESLGHYITAEPNLELKDVYIVSGYNRQFDDKNKNVRADYKPELHCVVKAKHEGKTHYFSDVEAVSLDGNVIHPLNSDNLKGSRIRWSKVENVNGSYTNSRQNRRWWAKLDYAEIPFKEVFGLQADVSPTILKNYGNFGTMRFKVDFEYQGQRKSTPGKESADIQGINDNVHRVSIRPDDSYVGWLKSFFNLPYIWGSSSVIGLGPIKKPSQEPASKHQAERYIGADCADFVVAGRRAMGHRDIPYFCSDGFRENGLYLERGFARVIIEEAQKIGYAFFDSKTQKPIKMGEGRGKVKEGDIVYFGGHMGVLSNNRGLGRILDEGDLYVDTLFHEPRERELANGFSPAFSVLRWND